MRNVILTLLLLGPAGCATQGKFEEMLRSWEGKDADSLVAKWGPPSKTFTTPKGSTVYSYHLSNGMSGGANCSLGNCVTYSGENFCDVSFTIDQASRVVNWRFYGNTCRSK